MYAERETRRYERDSVVNLLDGARGPLGPELSSVVMCVTAAVRPEGSTKTCQGRLKSPVRAYCGRGVVARPCRGVGVPPPPPKEKQKTKYTFRPDRCGQARDVLRRGSGQLPCHAHELRVPEVAGG